MKRMQSVIRVAVTRIVAAALLLALAGPALAGEASPGGGADGIGEVEDGAPSAPADAETAPASAEAWPPPGTVVIDGVVAIAGKEPITMGELARAAVPFMARAEAEGLSMNDSRRAEIMREVLDGLVNDVLVLEEARRLQIDVPARQVDQQVERLKDSNGWSDEELAAALKQHGFPTIAKYREHVRNDLLKNQVLSIKVASRVTLDEEDVKRAYADEIGGGRIQERRATHILRMLDPKLSTPKQIRDAQTMLQAARKRVLAGEVTFEDSARQLSQDSNADAGGDLGWFSKGDMVPEFEEVVFELGEGEVSDPIQTEFGLHLIKLTGIRERELVSDEEREKIERQIRFRLREKALERIYNQYIRELRKGTHVEIRHAAAGLDIE